jgi:hypothetical protein
MVRRHSHLFTVTIFLHSIVFAYEAIFVTRYSLLDDWKNIFPPLSTS